MKIMKTMKRNCKKAHRYSLGFFFFKMCVKGKIFCITNLHTSCLHTSEKAKNQGDCIIAGMASSCYRCQTLVRPKRLTSSNSRKEAQKRPCPAESEVRASAAGTSLRTATSPMAVTPGRTRRPLSGGRRLWYFQRICPSSGRRH